MLFTARAKGKYAGTVTLARLAMEVLDDPMGAGYERSQMRGPNRGD
jgi:hypothetical protein